MQRLSLVTSWHICWGGFHPSFFHLFAQEPEAARRSRRRLCTCSHARNLPTKKQPTNTKAKPNRQEKRSISLTNSSHCFISFQQQLILFGFWSGCISPSLPPPSSFARCSCPNVYVIAFLISFSLCLQLCFRFFFPCLALVLLSFCMYVYR